MPYLFFDLQRVNLFWLIYGSPNQSSDTQFVDLFWLIDDNLEQPSDIQSFNLLCLINGSRKKIQTPKSNLTENLKRLALT